jgi:hypothetical protein
VTSPLSASSINDPPDNRADVTSAAVVLYHRGDATARALISDLMHAQAVSRVVAIEADELSRSRWSHYVGHDGAVATTLTPPGGEDVVDASVGVVVNRIRSLRSPALSRASVKDQAYGSAEMHALLGSWLFSLGDRVLNQVSPHGVDHIRSAREWLTLALHAGFDVVPTATATSRRALTLSTVGKPGSITPFDQCDEPTAYPARQPATWTATLTPDTCIRQVTVVGEMCFNEPTAAAAQSALQLAKTTLNRLLGITLAGDRVINVSSQPTVPTSAIRALSDLVAAVALKHEGLAG